METTAGEPRTSTTWPGIDTGIFPNYTHPIELLDESEHHDSVELTKKINELIRKSNKL